MRRVALCLLLLAACGVKAEPSEASRRSPVDAPTPVAEAAKATGEVQAGVTVGGRLRAHDGGPLRAAEFTVLRNGFIEPVAKGPLAADGSFRVAVEPGVYTIVVAAVDHAQIGTMMLVERAVDVTGNLGTYARAEPGEVLRLRTELLDAAGTVIESGPKDAVRAGEGRYRLALADRPGGAVKLRYQIETSGGRTYNGPLADSYESDGGGDYWSVVELAGREAIELDLGALPPAGKAAGVTWRGESAELAAMRAYRDRWSPRVEQQYASTPRKDGKIMAPGEKEKAEMAALAAEALAEADAAGSDDARMLLRLVHLDLFGANDDDAAAAARTAWVFEHVDPMDPRLGLFWNVNNMIFGVLRSADEALATRGEAWLGRMQGNPNVETALDALSFFIHQADERGDDARVDALYAVAREPRFAGTYAAKHLAQQFDPGRILRRGKPFPDFEFPALAADGRPITKAERAGRLYLVEFWATWCGPCVYDMPDLHAAYAKLNGIKTGEGEKGLRRIGPVEEPAIEFVFVSLDQSREDLAAFREQHWPMPWTHAFVGRDREREVMERYGFSGVPTAVLVDGDGTIVEVGAALRRERLLPTLERALAARRRPAG